MTSLHLPRKALPDLVNCPFRGSPFGFSMLPFHQRVHILQGVEVLLLLQFVWSPPPLQKAKERGNLDLGVFVVAAPTSFVCVYFGTPKGKPPFFWPTTPKKTTPLCGLPPNSCWPNTSRGLPLDRLRRIEVPVFAGDFPLEAAAGSGNAGKPRDHARLVFGWVGGLAFG